MAKRPSTRMPAGTSRPRPATQADDAGTATTAASVEDMLLAA